MLLCFSWTLYTDSGRDNVYYKCVKMSANCILFVVVCYLLCDFVPAIFCEGEHRLERSAILHRNTREFLFFQHHYTPCPDLKLNLSKIVEVTRKK